MTTYAKIENGQLTTAKNEPIEVLKGKGFLPFDEELVAKYFAGLAKIQGGVLLEDSEKIAAQEKQAQVTNLQAQIDEFDKKRIRAGFEPMVKDEVSGQTWLEYYTLQIRDLRAQIANL